MGHVGIPVVGVVLHQQQSPGRLQHRVDEGEHRRLVADEVERIRHDDPVERVERERLREVGAERAHRGAARSDPTLELAQRAAVTVDGDDLAAWSDELCECERERAGPGAEVGPRPTARHAFTQEADVVRVVH